MKQNPWDDGKTAPLKQLLPQNFTINWQSVKNLKITYSVILICGAVYLAQKLLGESYVFYWLHFPDFMDFSQIWRLITPIFMHDGIFHIGFNLAVWYYFASKIELRLGWLKLTLLTIFAALCSNFAQAILVNIYFVGLSGVVYALIGFVWVYALVDKFFSFNKFYIFIASSLIIGASLYLFEIYVANYAHIIGLVSGMLYAGILILLKKVSVKT